VVARRVLRLIGVPLTLAAGAYLTAWALGHADLGRASRGHGGLAFLAAVDLALAIPISWAPFAADYARFSRSPRGAFAGTLVGCSLANAWFYSLGALLVLAGAADPSIGLTPAVGVLAVAALALAETDKPFADLYSSVVSVQNAFPRWRARPIALALGAVVAGAALVVPLARYTAFLYLLGSCFVPLAGVQLAHAWRSRLWAAAGRFDSVRAFPRLNLGGLAAWVAGFLVYQWIAPTPVGTWPAAVVDVTSTLGIGPAPSWLRLGASLPSFAVAFAFASALGGRRR
jgi:purine-cytosine permease-like protein